jgi:hypothetical protein
MTTRYPLHPACAIFPPMSDDEFDRLKSDIGKNGLNEPIVVQGGQVVDGRHRLRSLAELGIEPGPGDVFELHADDDPWAFVVSANLRRRQLRPSQRAMAAARLANVQRGDVAKQRSANLQTAPLVTVEQAADIFGVSTRAIESAKTVLRDGCADLIALCDAGRSVATACRFVDATEGKKNQATIIGAAPVGGAGQNPDAWAAVRKHLADADDKPSNPGRESATSLLFALPARPTADAVAAIGRWLAQHDKRPAVVRFSSLWEAADAAGQAAIRAMILDPTPSENCRQSRVKAKVNL